jgi:hypothetical protein
MKTRVVTSIDQRKVDPFTGALYPVEASPDFNAMLAAAEQEARGRCLRWSDLADGGIMVPSTIADPDRDLLSAIATLRAIAKEGPTVGRALAVARLLVAAGGSGDWLARDADRGRRCAVRDERDTGMRDGPTNSVSRMHGRNRPRKPDRSDPTHA